MVMVLYVLCFSNQSADSNNVGYCNVLLHVYHGLCSGNMVLNIVNVLTVESNVSLNIIYFEGNLKYNIRHNRFEVRLFRGLLHESPYCIEVRLVFPPF